MNIGQLEYLVETVKKGSYHAASKTLFVTPEAVSKSINTLEKELCVNFLVRSGRGIAPTDLALRFVEKAEDILDQVHDLRIYAQSCSNQELCTGSLALGVATTHHRGEFFLPSMFKQFCSAHPNIELDLLYNSSEACLSALHENIIDAAIVLGKNDTGGFENHLLKTYIPHVAVAESSPIARIDTLRLAQLNDVQIATPTDMRCEYASVKALFEHHGLKPNFVPIAPYIEAHHRFLQEGGAILVAKNTQLTSIFHDIKVLPFRACDQIRLPLYLTFRSNSAPSPITLLCDYLQAIKGSRKATQNKVKLPLS